MSASAAATGVEEGGERGTGSGNLLQQFWGLSSLKEEERLGAARELLTTLATLQVRLAR